MVVAAAAVAVVVVEVEIEETSTWDSIWTSVPVEGVEVDPEDKGLGEVRAGLTEEVVGPGNLVVFKFLNIIKISHTVL